VKSVKKICPVCNDIRKEFDEYLEKNNLELTTPYKNTVSKVKISCITCKKGRWSTPNRIKAKKNRVQLLQK